MEIEIWYTNYQNTMGTGLMETQRAVDPNDNRLSKPTTGMKQMVWNYGNYYTKSASPNSRSPYESYGVNITVD